MNNLRNYLLLGFLLKALGGFASSPSHADTPVVSLGDVPAIEISNQTEIFLDESRELSFQDLSHPNFTGFKRNSIVYPSFGAYTGRAWLRFAVENRATEPVTQVILLSAPVLSAHLYFTDRKGKVQDFSAGRDYTTNAEYFPNRFPSFPVRLEPKQTQIFYLAIESDIVYTTKLSLNSFEAFFQTERLGNYIAGFVTGTMLIMLLYNFFLYLSTRDITFLWYALTVLTLHLAVVANLLSGGEFFGMRLPFGAHYIVIAAKIIGSAFLVQFSRVFLQTPASPRIDLFLKISLASAPVLLLLLPFVPLPRLNSLNNLFIIPGILLVIIYSGHLFSKGYSYARFYFIAWFPFLLAGFINVVLNMSGKSHLLPNSSIMLVIAACIEVLLLSMALGDKINQMKQEKDLAEAVHREEILDMNRSLEATVKEKTRDIRSMFDNLKLGIFTVDYNMTISTEYSKYLTTMADADTLKSLSGAKIIFHDSLVGNDVRNQVETAVMSSIGDDDLGFNLNQHLLIRQFQKRIGDQLRDFELDWAPIENDKGAVEKILVAMKEVTEFNALKRTSEEQKRQMDLMSQYLTADRTQVINLEMELVHLVESIRKFANEFPPGRERHLADDFINIVFGKLHTQKAISRKLKLSYLSDNIHEGEEYLHQVRHGQAELSDAKLLTLADNIEACLREYHHILEALGLNQAAILDKASVRTIDQIVLDILSERVPLAQDLNKPIPAVKFDWLDQVELNAEINRAIETSLIHLLRNSLDHGIESSAERMTAAKNERGLIAVAVSQDQGFCRLDYRDDGWGLDLDKVFQKAQMNSLIKSSELLTKEQVAKLIFTSGFSTKDNVTEISGRGIGLDAAATEMKKIGGELKVQLIDQLESGRFGRWSIAFQLVWPAVAQGGRNVSNGDSSAL